MLLLIQLTSSITQFFFASIATLFLQVISCLSNYPFTITFGLNKILSQATFGLKEYSLNNNQL